MRAFVVLLLAAWLAPGCTLVLDRQRHRGSDAGEPSADASRDGAIDASELDAPRIPDDAGVDACSGSRVVTVMPGATGAVAYYPELGGMRVANPVGASVVSSYFRSTEENRELRRGVVELVVPPEVAGATRAVLRFTTTAAPTEAHDVVAYLDANDLITIADYDRAASPVGTIGLEAVEHGFDVLSLLQARAGEPLGFRLQLAPPLDSHTANGNFGIEARSPRIELELPCP